MPLITFIELMEQLYNMTHMNDLGTWFVAGLLV